MSSALIKIIVQSTVGKAAETLDIQPGAGAKGQSVRIKAQDGFKYQLKDMGEPGQKAPKVVKLKRVGKDLLIGFEEGIEAADVVLENYYGELFDVPPSLIGESYSGNLYQYAIEASQAKGSLSSLIELPNSVNALLTGAEVSLPSLGAGGVAALNLPVLGSIPLGVVAANEIINKSEDTAAADKLEALTAAANAAGKALAKAQEDFDAADLALANALASLEDPATPAQLKAVEDAQEALTAKAAELSEAASTAQAAVAAANAAAIDAKVTSPVPSLAGLSAAIAAANEDVSATPATLASSIIQTYAQSNGVSNAPDADDYKALAVEGIGGAGEPTVEMINSALATMAINGGKADSAADVQAIVDAYKAILAEANGATADASATDPTAEQYAAIGVTGVDAGPETNLLGDVIGGKESAAIASASDIQTLADTVAKALEGEADKDELGTLGLTVTGITEDNLAAVQAALAAAPDADIASLADMQEAIDQAVASFDEASDVIEAFADGGATAPDAGHYKALAVEGIGGEGEPTVEMINSALATAAIDGEKADSAADVQAIVDAYKAILAEANGATADASATDPTAEQYAAIGVTGVDAGAETALLGDVIGNKNPGDVDSASDIQTLADTVAKALAGTADKTELGTLGLTVTGITEDNLAAVQAALAAAPDADIASLADMQAVIAQAVASFDAASEVIEAFADGGATAPDAGHYKALAVEGIGGEGEPTVEMINSALATAAIDGEKADSAADVQAIVDAYKAILAEANGATADASATDPTAEQYAAIGVTGVDAGPETDLLGDVIGGKESAAIASASDIQTLADTVAKALAGTADATELGSLGLVTSGITTDNLGAVQAALAAAQDADIDSLADMQAVIDAAVAALDAIELAAQNNSATASSPSVEQYAAIGVVGVDAQNLAAINSALNDSDVQGAQADTQAKVKAIVEGFNAILANANDETTANAEQGDYAAIGVNGVDTAEKVNLLGDVIDGKADTDVNTVAKVQALAATVEKALSGTADATELGSLGLVTSGITTDNLGAVQAALAAAQDADIDSLADMQAVIDAAVAALDAIELAAQNNSATASSPSVEQYAAIGVVGVDAQNLAAINSALNDSDVQGAQADTQAKVKAIVEGFNAILANANDETTANAEQGDYAAIGVNGVDAGPETNLLGDVIDGKAAGDVNTVQKVQDLAGSVQAIMDLAALTGTTSLADAQTANANVLSELTADLSALGLNGVNAQNIGSIWAAIRDTANTGTGVDTVQKIQDLIDAANDAPVNTLPVSLTTNEDTPLVITGLSVSDADAGSSDLTVTLDVTLGTLTVVTGVGVTLGANGTGSVSLTGSVTAINTLLATSNAVTYTPTGNANGSASLTMTTSDGGHTGTGGVLIDTDTVAITVTAVNDAPKLGAIYTAMDNIEQGAGVPSGEVGYAVTDLFMAITDDDGEADPLGVAIVSVNANGTLYYSTDNGTNWLASAALSASSALHLDGNSRVYFRPNTGFSGNVADALVFRAWDHSNAVQVGNLAPIGTLTASAAYSSETSSVAITVVVPDSTAPAFSSSEGVTVVVSGNGPIYNAQATDAGGAPDEGITYAIQDGAYAALFEIDEDTGEVSFAESPSFSSNSSNVYDITILATDAAGNVGFHDVAITTVLPLTAQRVSTFAGNPTALVSNATVSSSNTSESAPVVVKLSGGGFFMAWYTHADGDGVGTVFGRYFDGNGAPVGAQLSISQWAVNGDLDTSMPALTAVALADNKVALGWQAENGPNGPNTGTTEVAYAMTSLSGSTPSVLKPQALASSTAMGGHQSAPVMVATDDGGFFMAWFNAENLDPSGTVTGRYFFSDGTPRTPEITISGTIQVNGAAYVNDSQPSLVATALADGKVAVAWVSDETTLMLGGSSSDIAHTVVSYSGVAGSQTASATAVQRGNHTAAGTQGPPVIATTGDGGYFMAWYNADNVANQGPLRGQYFDATGTRVGDEVNLSNWGGNGNDSADMPDLTVEALGNNTVVVGWQVAPTAGVGNGNSTEAAYILVSRTDTTVTVGTQALLNTTFQSNQSGPAIGKLANGGFFAAWYDGSLLDPASVVLGQYFNAAGGKVGDEILISGIQKVEGLDAHEMPSLSVTVLDNDRVDVAWIADGAVSPDGGGSGVVHTVLEAPYAWTSVSGVTAPGATVSLFRPGDVTAFATQTADASGAYSFSGLSLVPGTGKIVAAKDGITTTTDLHMGSGSANTLTTGSAAYALVDGRQGDDTINLTQGGRATLLYGNLGENSTGNNGVDTVTGFTLGDVDTVANADIINLSGMVLKSGEASEFVTVQQSGGNTQIWVDRDGTGTAYASTQLLTLNGVTTDLNTLLGNGQLVLPVEPVMTVSRTQSFSGEPLQLVSNSLVNASSTNNDESAPVVVKLSGGGFFMAWYEFGLTDQGGRVFGRYFDANGQTVGTQLAIGTWPVNGDDWTISMPNLTAVALADNQVALGWQTVNSTALGGPTATTEVAYALTSLTGGTASVFKAQALANTTQTDNQSAPLMVKTSDGGFFMAWFNNADNADPAGTVTGRYFNANGTPRTDEFNVSGTNQVNAHRWVNDSQPPLVAVALADGKVAVAWVSDETTLLTGGVGPDIAHVVVGYTGATGSAGAVQRGNNTAAGDQGPPVIAATGDGGYFMAWYSNDYQLDQGPLRGQYFDANGVPVGAEQALGTWGVYGDDGSDMSDLTVQTLANNTVVVGWQVHSTPGVGTGNTTEVGYILVSRTDTTVTVGTQALMNSTFAADQSGPAIGKLANGGFFAAWYDNSLGNPAGVVRGQYFNAAGVKVGAEVLVSDDPRVEGNNTGEMPSLSVTVLDNDRVDVAWIADNDDQTQTDLWGSAVVHTLLDAPYVWTAVSGKTNPGAEVELFVAGQSLGKQLANASTGAYQFNGLNVPVGVHKVVATVGGISTTTELHVGSSASNTVTTGEARYALVEGRQSDDTINLGAVVGQQATLLYGDLGNNAIGNNGVDTVNGFTLGNVKNNANADIINLVNLLLTPGLAADYVSVAQVGGNTQIWVDRDGTGDVYDDTHLLTLNGVSTDLSTLLGNGQLLLPINPVMTASRTQTYTGSPAKVVTNGVASSSNTYESAPVVVKLSGGGTFMAWYENADSDGLVYGRYYDVNGQSVGSKFLVGSSWRANGDSWASMPSLTAVALDDNQVAVGWQTANGTAVGPTTTTEVAYALTSLSGSTTSVIKAQALANTVQTGNQSAPVMVATSDGGFFMAWFNADELREASGTVTGRYFNANGTPRTAEFNVSGTIQVNGHDYINDAQAPLVATALADGKVAVAWVSDETTLMAGGAGPDIAHVVVEHDGTTGSAGTVQRGNDTAAGEQGPPVIATTGDGGYFMAWYSADYALNQGPLRGQYFDATGAKVGTEQTLGSWGVYGHDSVDMQELTVEALGNNTVVVGWQSAPTTGVGVPNTTEAAYTVVSRTGTTVTQTPQALLNTTTALNQTGPAIGKLANGGFFAAWYDNAQGDPAGVVRGQYFNAAGAKVGAEIAVSGNQTVEGWNGFEMPSLSVTVLDNDRVDVAWIAEGQQNADGANTAVVHTLLEAPYAWTAVSGTATVGATVELFVSGVSKGTQLVDDETGAYHFGGLSLSAGEHKLVASVEGVARTTELHIGSGDSNTLSTTSLATYALVEGRQGDDAIDLSAGGQATLLYGNLGDNSTGNNGVDTVTGFTVGNSLLNPNADIIHLADLLQGETAGTVEQFVEIVADGSDTLVKVDRDGAGSAYSSTHLLTLTGTTTTLEALMLNSQLVIG